MKSQRVRIITVIMKKNNKEQSWRYHTSLFQNILKRYTNQLGMVAHTCITKIQKDIHGKYMEVP